MTALTSALTSVVSPEDLLRGDPYRPSTIFAARYAGLSIPAFTSVDLSFGFYGEQYGGIFEPGPGGTVRIKQQGVIGYSLRVEMQVGVAGYVRYNLFSSTPSSELPMMAFSFPAVVNLLHQSGGIALMFIPGTVDYSLRVTNFSSATMTVFSAELRMAYLGRPDI